MDWKGRIETRPATSMNRGLNQTPPAPQVRLAPDDGVFELAGSKPAWMWVHTCPKPECACRTALIIAASDGRDQLLERGSAVRDAWTAGADYTGVAATLDDLVVFRMDIDTAAVFLPTSAEPVSLAAHPHIADIAQRIDGELLDSIGRLWYRGKGWPDPEQEALVAAAINIKGWKRGDMLAWDDIFTGARQDLFERDSRLYEAAEMYCPVPGCDCGEVFVHFETQLPRGAPSPGSVVVQRSGAAEHNPGRNGSATLEELWSAFRERHPNYAARFARRYPTMKRMGARIVERQQPAVSTKMGRNDACSCGSGKKYKRCCGAS